MTNKILAIATILNICLFQTMYAQNEADALLDKISEECCACSKENIVSTDSVSSAQLEMAIGLCLIQACGKYDKELATQGINISDQTAFNSYSEKIGEHLSRTCDHFLNILFKLMNDENSNTRKEAMSNMQSIEKEKSNNFTTTGTIKKIDGELFLRIWTEHNNGEDVFICLDELEDFQQLKNISGMIGKIVVITYMPVSIYSPKEQKMINMKKLIGIKLAD